MSEIKIGCVALVPYTKDQFVSIVCNKGRGITLPGGLWINMPNSRGHYETFSEAAERELREETGLLAKTTRFLYGGMSPDGNYTYTFIMTVHDFIPLEVGPAGLVQMASWDQLLNSRFGPYYDILKQVYHWSGVL